jgi:GNAT superfamily N-acetyltransferase
MFARKGIGRAILRECEREAKRAGFLSVELMSTLPGVHLYRACGYMGEERVAYEIDGVTIEFVPMRKELR